MSSTDNISYNKTTEYDHNRFQYHYLEGVESIERYRPGGYHPVTIGDQLNRGRYHVIHKLGFGGYSTCWLASDLLSGRYVAVKIATADSTHKNSNESEILRYMASTSLEYSSSGATVMPIILDEFTLTGPNGKHRCFVTIPASMSLAKAKDMSYFRLFQPHIARAIIAQLVQAVAFLHCRGIVHADLHLGNILLRLPSGIDELSREQLYKKYGELDLEPITRVDGKSLPSGVPTHGVVPILLGKASEDVCLCDAQINLTDFGEAFLPCTTERHYSNVPPLLVPPEARFSQDSLAFPADMWTLACVIWDILGQRPLFDSFFPTADRVTSDQVELLGKMPLDWWHSWETRLDWFTEDGEIKRCARKSWKERIEYCIQAPRKEKDMKQVCPEEETALFAMLKSMLHYDPQKRATAEEVLASEWVVKWAMPDLMKMKKVAK